MFSRPSWKVLTGLGFLIGSSLPSLGIAETALAATVARPGPPTQVAVIGADTAANATWAAPVSNGGAAIDRYKVTAKLAGKVTSKCVTRGGSGCIVTGLTNGVTYSITVRAHNRKGYGKPSGAAKVTATNAQNCSYFGPYANLQSCNLSGANLHEVNLTAANLQDTDLSGADLDEVSEVLNGRSGVVGIPAALPPNWEQVEDFLVGPGVILLGANLEGFDLSGADLSFGLLADSVIANATLTNANLSNANLVDANLDGANLDGADLIGARLGNTDFAGVTLTNVASRAIIGTPIDLPVNWELVDGYLVGPGANLSGDNLSGIVLSNADLAGTSFIQANLSNADLTDANLTGADLVNAILTGANLTGVTWSNTFCPDGTNSDNDGGTCVNNL